MKHHIIVKFLAIFLCAASLLGILGGAAGILVASEVGLNSRTPQEAYEESVQATAEALAHELSARYAAGHLGGADESLIRDYYGSHWMQTTFNWEEIGYSIADEDGTVLEASKFMGDTATAGTFSYGIQGSYLNVIRVLTEEEYHALFAPETTSPTYPPELAEELWVYNAVSQDGSKIHSVRVVYSDGHSEEYAPEHGYIGQLSYLHPDQLVFRIQSDYAQSAALMDDLLGAVPTGMTFRDSFGNIVFEITGPECLLTEICVQPGYFVLVPMGNAMAMEPSGIYDIVPAGGAAVAQCCVTYAGGWSETVGSDETIGRIDHDAEGHVVFTADSPETMAYFPERVVSISFRDIHGNLLYEARDLCSVGEFTPENNTLVFRGLEASVAEEISETTDVPEEEPEIWVYDDVPPGGYPVFRMEYWLEGSTQGGVLELTDDFLGTVAHDENGSVRFTARDWKHFVFSKPARVVYMLMKDMDGRVLYEARQKGIPTGSGCVIGTFAYDAEGALVFTLLDSTQAAIAPASLTAGSTEATQPEPTPTETAPAATEETVAETTAPASTEVTEPVIVPAEIIDPAAETLAEPAATEVTEPVIVPVETIDPAAEAANDYYAYHDSRTGEMLFAEYTFEPMPSYEVTVTMGPGALHFAYEWQLINILYALKDHLLYVLVGSLLLFAITAVYLCCSAAHKPGTAEVRPGGLNRLPLDLYLAGAAGGTVLCAFGIVEGCDYLLRNDLRTGIFFAVLLSFGACTLVVAFCFAFAAQVKAPGGYLWRNSLCGRSLGILAWLWRRLLAFCAWLLKWFDEKLEPLLVRCGKALWKLTKFFFIQLKRLIVRLYTLLSAICRRLLSIASRIGGWLGRKFLRFFSLLPLTWQWLLTGFVLVLLLYIMMRTYKVGYILVGFGAFFGVLLYAASAFATLLESARQMRKGDLDQKVDDRLLIGSFRDFADELNGLADVAVVAAQKQLKSERMKTELITNVSHDIRTPLTSIINYVDLMNKTHSPEEQQAYLEVLSRQSLRLKKLIDDLIEMSKASTGNMAVDITRVNATEAVNQALGEFSDKLDRSNLIPVFRQPEADIHMMADGRLVWRVLGNLLSNTVKYALPGTRVYIDLMELDGKVVLSLKNISREPLNVSADELLERFVRGDTARNTEGSGLGLNIAKSLMELQKGKLELLVDGDLFKVTLIFPSA